jgi:HNH endonuclease
MSKARDALLSALEQRALDKYGPAIVETSASLRELIELVKMIDPVKRRTYWPLDLSKLLYREQDGVCPICRKPLRADIAVDHIVPLAQGGDNREENVQLVHEACNTAKSDQCEPELVIRYLQSRLLSLPGAGIR